MTEDYIEWKFILPEIERKIKSLIEELNKLTSFIIDHCELIKIIDPTLIDSLKFYGITLD